MQLTTRIARERLASYFEEFTRRYLPEGLPRAVDVEVLSLERGDQFPVCGARLLGITYDPRSDIVEVTLDAGEHFVYRPSEVWCVEEADGFLSAIEVLCSSGSREIVTLKRVGLRRID